MDRNNREQEPVLTLGKPPYRKHRVNPHPRQKVRSHADHQFIVD